MSTVRTAHLRLAIDGVFELSADTLVSCRSKSKITAHNGAEITVPR